MRRKKINYKRFVPAALILAIAAGALVYTLISAGREPAVTVYFLRDSSLCPRARPLLKGDDRLRKAADELMAGPNEAEREERIFSEIPAGTRIISLRERDDMIEVKFNERLSEYGGGSAKVRGLVAQIVYTFTEAAGVSRVRILVGDDQEVVLGGEGYIIDKPLSREDAGL